MNECVMRSSRFPYNISGKKKPRNSIIIVISFVPSGSGPLIRVLWYLEPSPNKCRGDFAPVDFYFRLSEWTFIFIVALFYASLAILWQTLMFAIKIHRISHPSRFLCWCSSLLLALNVTRVWCVSVLLSRLNSLHTTPRPSSSHL